MNPKDTGDIGASAAGGDHGENLRPLMRHQLWPPATPAALFASRLQTGAGSLANHGALEFGERAEHLHVRLLYSKDGLSGARIDPEALLQASLRMRPDRVLLQELRDEAAWTYVNEVVSGHPAR
jgi:hypothetical protein